MRLLAIVLMFSTFGVFGDAQAQERREYLAELECHGSETGKLYFNFDLRELYKSWSGFIAVCGQAIRQNVGLECVHVRRNSQFRLSDDRLSFILDRDSVHENMGSMGGGHVMIDRRSGDGRIDGNDRDRTVVRFSCSKRSQAKKF